eukprot:ctg_181.g71
MHVQSSRGIRASCPVRQDLAAEDALAQRARLAADHFVVGLERLSTADTAHQTIGVLQVAAVVKRLGEAHPQRPLGVTFFALEALHGQRRVERVVQQRQRAPHRQPLILPHRASDAELQHKVPKTIRLVGGILHAGVAHHAVPRRLQKRGERKVHGAGQAGATTGQSIATFPIRSRAQQSAVTCSGAHVPPAGCNGANGPPKSAAAGSDDAPRPEAATWERDERHGVRFQPRNGRRAVFVTTGRSATSAAADLHGGRAVGRAAEP